MHELSGHVVFVFVGFSQDFCDGVDVSRLIRALLSPFFFNNFVFAYTLWIVFCVDALAWRLS